MDLDLVYQLQSKLPADVCTRVVERLRELQRAAEQSEVAARSAFENVLHLKGNCAAEEQMRVALLEKRAPLEVEKSKLGRELAQVEVKVSAAKEAKRAITEEIERLNGDLFAEADKLVQEELEGKNALKVRGAEVLLEFDRLKSMMLLQKDRCVVCANLVREIPLSSGTLLSIDMEEGARVHDGSGSEEIAAVGGWRKASM
jgi:hypothetical protein